MGMDIRQQGVKVGHCAEVCHDIAVIADVIAVVHIRRLIDRVQPQHIDAKVF